MAEPIAISTTTMYILHRKSQEHFKRKENAFYFTNIGILCTKLNIGADYLKCKVTESLSLSHPDIICIFCKTKTNWYFVGKNCNVSKDYIML